MVRKLLLTSNPGIYFQPLFLVKNGSVWVCMFYNNEEYRNHHANKTSNFFYRTVLRIVHIY